MKTLRALLLPVLCAWPLLAPWSSAAQQVDDEEDGQEEPRDYADVITADAETDEASSTCTV